MGLQQSKDEQLFVQVNSGNVEGIRSLHREGAGLEWTDREGKTPLIASCMKPELYNVAATLIELGANANAYGPGRQAGTPLHHAAKRGLDQTVKLLLSHGANALVMNDDYQTPLDVARTNGYNTVVRAIEDHLCLFSGWLLEFYGPGFLNLLVPQLLSRKIWVVVLPCASRNLQKPLKLELAVYDSRQNAEPRTIFPLWKSTLDEPNFNLPDPVAIISAASRIPRRWRRRRGLKRSQEARYIRMKLGPVSEAEKEQLRRFCNACKGIPQLVVYPSLTFQQHQIILPAPPATPLEGNQASVVFTTNERPPSPSSTTTDTLSMNDDKSSSGEDNKNHDGLSSSEVPSAPPNLEDDGPIVYPLIDTSSLIDSEMVGGCSSVKKEEGCCSICLDAAVEGACVPCGHMAGCMSCLNEIKDKHFGCPVCRASIDRVIRVYTV